MGKKLYEESNIAAIAETIRKWTHAHKTYTPAQMPEGVEEAVRDRNQVGYDTGYDDGWNVGMDEGWEYGFSAGWDDGYAEGEDFGYGAGYDTGYSSGVGVGYSSGVADGKKAERDAFWDVFQENGTRTNYSNAFNSTYWNHLTFKPTYDLKPVGDARNMFATFGSIKVDPNTKTYPKMTEILADAGVTLDTSLVTNARQMFYTCRVSDLPPLDLTSATDIYCLFYDSWKIETIEITLAPNKVTNAAGMFSSCSALINLTVHGVIDVNGISLPSLSQTFRLMEPPPWSKYCTSIG